MVIASDCVGLTLPGIIELPGSFAGSMSSPMLHRGPDPSHRISLAIFISEQASVFMTPLASTIASCAASASNLLGAVIKSLLVSKAIFSATFTAKSR